MIDLTQSQRHALDGICRRHGVRRLDLFGSALGDEYVEGSSDIDFVVDLGQRPPADYADAYFALKSALESLFGRPIDLIAEQSIQNPHFRAAIERRRLTVHGA